MADNLEKERRRALKKEFKAKEREAVRSMFPVDSQALVGLFDYVGEQVDDQGCDHTLKFSLEYATRNGWDADKTLSALEANGGYCDCEVLMNVEELVNDE